MLIFSCISTLRWRERENDTQYQIKRVDVIPIPLFFTNSRSGGIGGFDCTLPEELEDLTWTKTGPKLIVELGEVNLMYDGPYKGIVSTFTIPHIAYRNKNTIG